MAAYFIGKCEWCRKKFSFNPRTDGKIGECPNCGRTTRLWSLRFEIYKRLLLAGLVIVAGLFVLAIGVYGTSPAVAAESIVVDWLIESRNGYSGKDLWKDPGVARSLFSVRRWKILRVDVISTNLVDVAVRIESSTKGGFPIVQDWAVSVWNTDGKWKIGDVSELRP